MRTQFLPARRGNRPYNHGSDELTYSLSCFQCRAHHDTQEFFSLLLNPALPRPRSSLAVSKRCGSVIFGVPSWLCYRAPLFLSTNPSVSSIESTPYWCTKSIRFNSIPIYGKILGRLPLKTTQKDSK